jgi:integrase
MPALPQGTYRTPHGFQFRVVVPESLRQIIGKREIKKSLGRDYRTAVSEARLLALQVDRQFAEAREHLGIAQAGPDSIDSFLSQPIDARYKPITKVTPELVAGIKALWLASLDADLQWRRQGVDDEDFDALQQNIADFKARIARALARGDAEPFIPAVRGLLAGRGYELAVAPEEERQLTLDVLPALQEGYDILELRQSGRLVEPRIEAATPLPAAWEKPSTATTGITWDALLDHWKNDRSRPARTVRDVEAFVAALRACLPAATPTDLTRGQVTEWLRHEREKRGNSAATLEKKGTLVGALFSVAVKDELLEKNPFAGYDYSRFAAKEGLAQPNKRMPFTEPELKRIFSDSEGVFSVLKPIGGGGYHARVWIPLLGWLTGARLDEIGSLTVDNVHRDPVPYISITRGKTQNSVRDVPLHPELIRLGFLDYVDAVRKAGHHTLWPHLKTASDAMASSELLGKWFNRFLRESLKLPTSVVFHSFRHTFKDMCRNALIPRDVHHALTGHADDRDGKDEGSVGDQYGVGFSLETKAAQVKKIEIPFVIPRPAGFGAVRGTGK